MILDRCLVFRPEWQAGRNDWNLDISPRVPTATGSISGMAIADCGFRSSLHSAQKVLSLSERHLVSHYSPRRAGDSEQEGFVR